MRFLPLLALLFCSCAAHKGGYTLGVTLGFKGISAGVTYSPAPEPQLVVPSK